ncbi:MAG: CBS domain-containing protein [Alphaproteobacteria bacterium]|nr:CBS domain-containing protein [Alphaproteobacteria bacterium]
MSEPSYVSVKDVMTTSPLVIDGLATVSQAINLMKEHSVSSLVVDKRDASDEYGILAVHDIAEQIVATDRAADRVNVYEIMSKPVLSVDVGMNIKYAVRLLSRFKLTRALVLDQGKVAGIVTLRDLVVRSLS